jgi:cyanate permease
MIASVISTVTLPISVWLESGYEVSHFTISMIPVIFLIMYPIFTFVSSELIMKKGVWVANFIGQILLILAALSRLLVNYNFYTVIIGSVFAGAARPLIINS